MHNRGKAVNLGILVSYTVCVCVYVCVRAYNNIVIYKKVEMDFLLKINNASTDEYQFYFNGLRVPLVKPFTRSFH